MKCKTGNNPFSSHNGCKPRIDYPCRWQYKIIGESAEAIRKIVAIHVTEATYTLTESNVSRTGRYVSMNLDMTVNTEEQRLELYKVLAAGPEIKVVI